MSNLLKETRLRFIIFIIDQSYRAFLRLSRMFFIVGEKRFRIHRIIGDIRENIVDDLFE